MNTILQASHLKRHAGGRSILDDVSLQIRGGDRVAIVGPTGSGKTVLLRALVLLDPLDTGNILWHGRAVEAQGVPKFRSRVTYLHQRPSLAEGTVEENLRQPFTLRIHREKQFNPHAQQSRLASLGRDESFLAKQQSDLSGGESQITALLRAIQLDPEMLLLDEPTSGLDWQATQSVEQLIDTWLREKREERAAVWVTHDRQQAERVADEVWQMNDGFLVS